ncbi:MAG: ferrous iron transporter B [Clostridia bacterium]|nr:ferrous iron transporter B [Clostridia bacterium]
MRIALTGNPNSGKTTMYNALTGSNEKVGNWAGVTVDKKEHLIRKVYYSGDEQLIAVDLPGAYSMSPFTSEESVTSQYVKEENPDVIINIVDATNLSRSLFFTTQLLELGIPVVIALNKSDINKKKQTKINAELLEKRLGCTVVNTISTSSDGLKAVIEAAVRAVGKTQTAPYTDGNVDMTDKASVEAADRKRFEYVNGLVKEVESRKVFTKDKNFGDAIDNVLTNKWLGIPIFAVVMWLVFQISQVWVGKPVADLLVGWLETFQGWIGGLFGNANPLLYALLVDGVIGGVIAVIGFLPLVMVMYFLIAILEDCGYMSRVAVVLDPIFKKVGLSGKSVIPFVITVGCAVPGIMASRTIRNERERRATAMIAPFMPCGAKIPVISLFAGAFFDNAGWVSTAAYLAGIVLIFLAALLVNRIAGYKAKKSYFIIELADYKFPGLWGAFKSMCSRGWSYIVKASTIILLCNTAVQIMQSFTWKLTVAESADASILASIAGPFAYLLVPIVGVLSWQLAAAAITGFIAKENVVGTLAVCFVGLENFIDTEELAMLEGAGAQVEGVMAITKVAALAYLMFNLYSPPCFAAIGAMNSEMKSAKWLWGGVGLQLAIGYTVAYSVYTVGTLVTAPLKLNVGAAIAGLVAIVLMAAYILFIIYRDDMKLKSDKVLGTSTDKKQKTNV